MKTSTLFDNAPFLSPWYISENSPQLVADNQYLKWGYIEKIDDQYVGLITLKDKNERIYGFIDAYNYILPSVDKTKFLIWKRESDDEFSNTYLKFELYDLNKLISFDLKEITFEQIKLKKEGHFFKNEPIATAKYLINPKLKEDVFNFPDEFKVFESFMIVTNCKGLYDDNSSFSNTLLLEMNAVTGIVGLFPQDWFNKSDSDFGYVWITRAIRGNDDLIYCQGIRMADFVLDKFGQSRIKMLTD